MSGEPYKESFEDKILSVANKLKGYDYKSVLKRELKDVEEPEELDIERMCKVILWHFEDRRRNGVHQDTKPITGSQFSNEDIWLTREEAADRIRVDISTIKRMIKNDKLKEYGTGRIKRYKASEVDASFQMMLGSAAPALCTESILYFVKKDFKILTFDKGKVYDIIYENAIWIYVYNKEWMDSIRLSKTQFRKHFSIEGELEYDANRYGGLL